MAGLINRARVREDVSYKREQRLRAQTELFYLAHEVLGYADITEYTHRQVADFFVQKDPRKPIADQDSIKSRMLLLPRGVFKTTFNISDGVQWMVDFPEVRILALTASNSDDAPLADAFVGEVAGHFHRRDYENSTVFHDLFPECVHTGKLKAGWFINPARTRTWREPSMMGASIEQSLSGWHFDVAKIEDIQDNRNSQTSNGLKKVKQNLFINLKMLMPWGYREMTGTRYGPNDVYGYMIDRLNPAVSKMLWKPAMEPKPQARKKYDEDPDAMTEDDWTLFFPEMLPYSFLMEKKAEDLNSYMTQYMNIATGSFVPTFDIERLHMVTLEQEMLPIGGSLFIAWRVETDDNPVCAGLVGAVEDGRLYVLDLVRGIYRPSTLANKIVHLAKVYGVHTIEMEETPGAHHHEQAIRNAALAAAWQLNIRWLPFDDDPGIRQLRIKSIEPLLKDGWIWLSKQTPQLKEIIRQMHHYGIIDDNELPDLVSRLSAHLPATALLSDRDDADDLEFDLMKQRDLYDRVYGLGEYVEPETGAEQDPEYVSPWDKGELEEIMPGLSG
jgi:hypothetical protein